VFPPTAIIWYIFRLVMDPGQIMESIDRHLDKKQTAA